MLSIPTGWIADKFGLKKILLIELAIATIVSATYGLAGYWWILMLVSIVSSEAMRVNPFTDILFINDAKPQQRGVVLSLARTLWSIPTIFAPMIAAIIVVRSGGINAAGIRPLYYIQVLLGLLVFASIALWLKAPEVSAKSITMSARKVSSIIRDFRDEFKDERWIKRWMIVNIIRSMDVRLVAPFVPLWIVSVKKADPYILGAMGIVGVAVGMILQIPVGRLADRIGRKKTFFLFCPFAYIGTLLLIMAPSPEYIILVGLLGGIGVFGVGEAIQGLGGGAQMPFVTMQHEMVPPEKRGRWQGILHFSNILVFPISILGGIMWQNGLMIQLFLLPILLELLIALPILSTIPDTLGRR